MTDADLENQVQSGKVYTCYHQKDGSSWGANFVYNKFYRLVSDDSTVKEGEWGLSRPNVTNGKCSDSPE